MLVCRAGQNGAGRVSAASKTFSPPLCGACRLPRKCAKGFHLFPSCCFSNTPPCVFLIIFFFFFLLFFFPIPFFFFFNFFFFFFHGHNATTLSFLCPFPSFFGNSFNGR